MSSFAPRLVRSICRLSLVLQWSGQTLPDDAVATSIKQHSHFESLQNVVTHTMVCVQILDVGEHCAMIRHLALTHFHFQYILRRIVRVQKEQSRFKLL